MEKKLLAIIVLVVIASLSIAGCTSSTSNSGGTSSTPLPSIVPRASSTPTSSVTASIAPTPQPTVTPQASAAATWHNYGYTVVISAQCVPAGCMMTDSYMFSDYQPHYAGNPRVTIGPISMKQCGPTYNARNCTASDVFVEVTVVQTGQVAHFSASPDERGQVIPFVD